MNVDDILDLIDAGLGRGTEWGVPIRADRCARAGCDDTPQAGHDFCLSCLAWLRGENDDPVALPERDAPNPEPVDEVVAWVELYGGTPPG